MKPINDIESIKCKLDSTLLKNNIKDTYSVTAKVYSCDNWNASGKILLSLPAKLVETNHPGKIVKNKTLSDCIEQGAIINCYGFMVEQFNESKTDKTYSFYVTSANVLGWDSPFSEYRSLLRLSLKRVLFSWGESGGFLLALLCGTKEYTCKEISDGFMKAGISHIIALSGMHVSFFSNLFILLTGFLFGKKSNTFCSLFIVTIFVWFAGISPSLLRALLCCFISKILTSFNIKNSILSVLSLSFIIQVVFFPDHITAVSFLLSYSALLGIVTIGEKLYPLLSKVLPNKISSSISSSIGAQLYTTPISLKIFGCIMPIGIIASVLITPLVFLFLAVGTICCIVSIIFPFCLDPLGVLINFLYNVIKFLVLFFARVPPIKCGL